MYIIHPHLFATLNSDLVSTSESLLLEDLPTIRRERSPVFVDKVSPYLPFPTNKFV